jgi:hypothetical protein
MVFELVLIAVALAGAVLAYLLLGRCKQKPADISRETAAKPAKATAPPAAAKAAAPAASGDYVTLKGKKPVTCVCAEANVVVTCSSDHVVRVFREHKSAAHLAVPGSPMYDFVAVAGAAVFAYEGFESAVHVFGLVPAKGEHAEHLRQVSKIAVAAPSKKDVVKSMCAARLSHGALVGLLFQSGVVHLYDAKSGKLVHSVPNEKIRTNGLALVPTADALVVLIATFDPACSVQQCKHVGEGAWSFERLPQLKAGGEELIDVQASAAGVALRGKDGQCFVSTVAEQFTVTRWKGPIAVTGKCKVSRCGKFASAIGSKRVEFFNKQLQCKPVPLPWAIADLWWLGSGSVVVSVAGDSNVYEIKNPFTA